MTKSIRLQRLKDLLAARAYTAHELAALTGVNVRSTQRDIRALEGELDVPIEQLEGGRYHVRKSDRLPRLDLNLQQARALFVAVRLFLRHSDEGDPEASTAMELLARIMPLEVRPQVVAAAAAMQRREVNHQFARNLATITEAWARRRTVKLSYKSAGKARPKEVIVDPYFLEPSAAGFATYLIGYSQTHGSIRTFKVERIVSVEKLPATFELPPDVNIDVLLTSAWGIIWGEGIGVALRFKPEVAWRVKESVWHPSQSIADTPDGGCVLTMSVASMMELGRWVRSWGDTVEVLEPAELREELQQEAVRLARLYSRPAKPLRRARAPRKRRTAATAPEQTPLPDSVA